MPLTPLEFEDECCRKCEHCFRARDMQKLGQKGHRLFFRADSREWCHEFNKPMGASSYLTHAYCQADQLRKSYG